MQIASRRRRTADLWARQRSYPLMSLACYVTSLHLSVLRRVCGHLRTVDR
jgi:hypothetical protein